jgi:uncharacterized protein YecE (DUF72 family)
MDPDIRVGLCGFSIAMRDYASRFPVVEIQHTFYQPPREELMAKWRLVTSASLEFTVKVWQLVTHPRSSPTYRRMSQPPDPTAETGFFRDTPAVDEGWRTSVRCAAVLHATAMLFQTPASFEPNRMNVENMRRFFARIDRPSGVRLLWEPRGPKWVAERNAALSLCDDLGLVHVVDPFVTEAGPADIVYWRLHGIGGARHSYSDAELRQLARDLLARRSGGPAYVMFNNLPRVLDASRFVAIVRELREGAR